MRQICLRKYYNSYINDELQKIAYGSGATGCLCIYIHIYIAYTYMAPWYLKFLNHHFYRDIFFSLETCICSQIYTCVQKQFTIKGLGANTLRSYHCEWRSSYE